jgi:hypothetical protein
VTILPGNSFEYGKYGVSPIKTVVLNGLAVGGSVSLVAAVTGKHILVVGGTVVSNGAYTQINFQNGSGGASLRIIAVPANTVATPNVPIVPTPYDTIQPDVGVGLFANNSAVIALLTINYIEYTP